MTLKNGCNIKPTSWIFVSYFLISHETANHDYRRQKILPFFFFFQAKIELVFHVNCMLIEDLHNISLVCIFQQNKHFEHKTLKLTETKCVYRTLVKSV